jgi:hypothetical protein
LDTWLSACVVFEENEAVLTELLELVRRHGGKGKQVHDANIVATVRANGLKRLATLNVTDLRGPSTRSRSKRWSRNTQLMRRGNSMREPVKNTKTAKKRSSGGEMGSSATKVARLIPAT